MQQKIPYGISDFKKIREENYVFIDKTKYIEKLESESTVMYVRPRRFGKSLFTSILDNYYAIDKKEEFEAYEATFPEKEKLVLPGQLA